MLRRILVPLDGSKFAEAALPMAMDIAEGSGAEAHLVLVHEPGVSEIPTAFRTPDPEAAIARRERENTYLRELGKRAGSAGLSRFTVRVFDGLAGPMLVEEIASYAPDLVVLATHGRGPVGRFLQGSMSDYLLHNVAAPFLLIKPEDRPTEAGAETVLVAWDLSSTGEAVLGPAADLAEALGAGLELVNVIEPAFSAPVIGLPGALDPDFREAERIEAQRGNTDESLNRAAEGLRSRGVRVAVRSVIGTTVADTLIALANEGSYSAIALSTHARSGLSRLLMGSVADQVIRGVHRPALVVRPPAPPE